MTLTSDKTFLAPLAIWYFQELVRPLTFKSAPFSIRLARVGHRPGLASRDDSLGEGQQSNVRGFQIITSLTQQGTGTLKSDFRTQLTNLQSGVMIVIKIYYYYYYYK